MNYKALALSLSLISSCYIAANSTSDLCDNLECNQADTTSNNLDNLECPCDCTCKDQLKQESDSNSDVSKFYETLSDSEKKEWDEFATKLQGIQTELNKYHTEYSEIINKYKKFVNLDLLTITFDFNNK